MAVIGANRSRGKIGSEIVHNLIASGFTGTVVPVNPAASAIDGLKTCANVADIPGDVDLAIIAVPAAEVLDAARDAIAKGVKALCVISAGFGESDAAGVAREKALVTIARQAGCRIVGPNCMGLLNTDPRFSLNATFSPVYPPAGSIAMSTQSGALGLAILDYTRQLDIGISSFVSVGNKADVSVNDLLEYWEHDPRTSVILLYVESFGNPSKFSTLARRISRTKPIVALKSGRSTAGARAAASHTGALAASDTFVDALFYQSGVIRTDTITELFDVATLLAKQPVPRGRRIAILTNAGGPAILAADACLAHGLETAPLTDATRSALRAFLPHAASVGNPVDMLASAPPDHYGRAMKILLDDATVDSVMAIFIPPLVTSADAVAAAIARAVQGCAAKPVVGVFMRSGAAPAALANVPCYSFPEPAAIALARVTKYGEWRQRPVDDAPPALGIDRVAARGIIDGAMTKGGGWLNQADAARLMRAAGIATPRWSLTCTAEEAVAAAAAIGFPVALKAVGHALVHKTERKAIHLNLADDHAVREAALDLQRRLGSLVEGLLVQQMTPAGVEMMIGALDDPTFGHAIVCGMGGVLVNLLNDSAWRLCPVDGTAAAEMINQIKGARLLRGFRGAPVADEAALRDVIVRVSALIAACPEIEEMDVNPVTVLEHGAVAVDVRIRVGAPVTAKSPAIREVSREPAVSGRL